MDQGNDRLNRLEARVAALEQRFPTAEAANKAREKQQSAKEFLLTLRVASETQKVLALAYFLEHVNGVSPFNVADLETIFRSAREKLPKNMNDAVNKNVARGFLMEASSKKDAKKAWVLTATGERFVEQEIPQ